MANMVKKKNMIKLILFLVISLIVWISIFKFTNFDKIKELENDFHYNMISVSSIIGGFLFTGLGILITAIDKDRVKRLWEHHYLDNLYRISIIGIVFDIIAIVSALSILCFNISDKIIKYFITFELTAVSCGILSFGLSIIHLRFIIKMLKPHN